MTDWGALYRDHVSAVAALAEGLDDDQLASPVPATPLWTAREVIAHVTGGAADAVSGRMDGAPQPEWTARHVAERADVPVADLVAELRSNQDAIAASTVDNPRPAIVWDIAVHHADLHEALGLGRVPERFWLPVVELIGPMRAPELVDAVPGYDLFRALFSRRSTSQIIGLGVPAERAAEIGIFGPRDDDQPVPA